MGLATDIWVAQSPTLREKVQAILIDFVSDNSTTPDAQLKQLIERIASSPERSAALVTQKIVIDDGGIDVDSDRAAITAVVNSVGTKNFLLRMFSIE